MSLSDKRRQARINALTTAAAYLDTFDWSNFDKANTDEETFAIFLEECNTVYKRLENQAEKLRKK
jgi:hypothetical protein|tara:strand:- start:13670 stop:13864 length:195 start_codon:yes stop_codon:yes gene_type:complete